MRKVIALAGFEVLIACGLLFSQNIASSIVGRVTDASGAAVPGVKVTVTNAGTGVSITVKTGSSGTYSAPELFAGEYEVKAEKSGFETFTENGIRVMSAEIARVDIRLNVGGVHQVVSVTGRAPLINTDSMSISSSVTTRQLSDLPTSLQTVDAFISLAPGVQSYNGDMSNPPIGGGTHWGSVNFTLNGVGVNQPGNSGGVDIQGVGLLVMPPPSSIQELKVQSNNMTAQYKAHSAVTLVTKAGTNQFHGEVYEYLQNTDLNANSFLLNASGQPRAPDHLNQFGGNLGGPLWRNKAFFFFDYTGYRHQDSAVVRHNYPTMAERGGDFSALCSAYDANGVCLKGKGTQLYNPWTGQPFAGNIIPNNLISPVSQKLLTYLPSPTDTSFQGLPSGPNNYLGLIPRTQNVDSEDARIDYNISTRDRIFGVYAQRITDPWFTSNGYAPTFGEGRSTYKNYSVSAAETHTFSPNTLNVFRAAWGDYIQRFSGQNGDVNIQQLFPSAPPTLYNGLPDISVTGYGGSFLFHDVGTAYPTPQWDVELSDDITHIQGKHTFQAGIDETGYKIFSRHTTGNSTGTFAFNGHWTGNLGYPAPAPTSGGNAFADFLLGTAASSATPGIGVFAKMIYSRDWGVYAQDTWQVTPKLTINYGVRYEYQTPWQYRNPEVTTIDLGNAGGLAGTNSPLVIPETNSTPSLPGGADPALFAAYPFETTSALGLPLQYVQPDKNNWAPRIGFAWRPFGGTHTVIRAGYGVYYNFQPGYVGSRNDAWNPPWILGYTASYATNLPGRSKLKAPYSPDITFGNGISPSDPYPGANGNGSVAKNPSLAFFDRNFRDAVAQEWNFTVEHQFGSNWATRISYVGSQTHHLPNNAEAINVPVTQTPDAPLQAQRPLQPWAGVNLFNSPGSQNFNQLQANLSHRFGSGFSINANYEYTHSLDDAPNSGGPQNWHFANLDYGESQFIHRHWVTFDYIYELPFGRGQRWMSGLHGFGNAVLGGWQVSGITHYATGTPFSVLFSQTGTGIIGWWGGRADRVGSNVYARQSGHDIVDGVQWVNLNAFAPPAEWTWGNSERGIGFGPGSWNWDMSAMKSFSLPERLQFQLRADFLDAFNHLNLDGPSNFSIPDLRDGGNPISNAGQIIGGDGSRVIQLSLRLLF